MNKLLKHLTNAPVAIALAFLLVGAPAAPVAQMSPDTSVGVAHASVECGHRPCRPWDLAVGIVLVLSVVSATVAVIWLVDVIWSMTNPEQEGMFDAMHAYIWTEESDDQEAREKAREELEREAEEFKRDWCNRATRGQRVQAGC